MSTQSEIEDGIEIIKMGASQADRIKAVSSAVLGNILEWFDFAVYAFFATIIAAKFFPSEDHTVSILATFAVFGGGFLARPIGSIIIGKIADSKGRKVALIITIYFMALSTIGIGLLPSYETIGIFAPILLMVFRIVQGLAAGGEFGGATAFIVEWAPENRRGFYGSFVMASLCAGMLLGSGVAAIVTSVMSEQALVAWGWRIPFLLGVLILIVGVYMRSQVGEAPAFEKAKKETTPQQSEAKSKSFLIACKAFGISIVWTGSFYVLLSYMPTFTQTILKLSKAEALWSNTVGLLVIVIAIPLCGLASDIFGRRKLLLIACVFFIFLTYPLFSLMIAYPTFTVVVTCQIIFSVLAAFYNGPAPAAMAEMFSTESRTLWMSLGYSVSNAIFGGFAPFIVTLLIKFTGSPQSPSLYVIPISIVSAAVILNMRETAHDKLK